MGQICKKRLQYISNGFCMLEIDKEFDKRLRYVFNDACMCEMA